jgi:hypothetical protein
MSGYTCSILQSLGQPSRPNVRPQFPNEFGNCGREVGPRQHRLGERGAWAIRQSHSLSVTPDDSKVAVAACPWLLMRLVRAHSARCQLHLAAGSRPEFGHFSVKRRWARSLVLHHVRPSHGNPPRRGGT